MNVLASILVRPFLLFLLYCANSVGNSSADSTCAAKNRDDGKCGPSEKADRRYSESANRVTPEKSQWSGFLEQIHLAEANYVECRNIPESCSCYQHLIEGDLEPFEEIK